MSKPHRKSLIRQVIERLDSKMAIGESRYTAKKAARKVAEARGEKLGTFSDGLIHSHKTRTTYQEHILRFVNWARTTFGIDSLTELDPRADELASRYLEEQLQERKSPWTLQTIRSALRLFFANRALASQVHIPARKRELISRSRHQVARDRNVQPEHWQLLLHFQSAVGLRKNELRRIQVKDIYQNNQGNLVAYVSRGKGGKTREVPVLRGHEQDVLAAIAGRDPEERIFARLPDTEMHALRRAYAQALYLMYAGAGATLPPTDRRLRKSDYDPGAVDRVSQALGHVRRDIVLRHYLR